MRYVLFALVLMLPVGCKGPKGEQGNPGVAGTNGAGKVEQISGVVLSDDFLVTDSRIKLTSNITVAIGAGGAWSELPYFLPGDGINTFFILRSGSVEIFNAKKASASGYMITILTPTPSTALEYHFGERLLRV